MINMFITYLLDIKKYIYMIGMSKNNHLQIFFKFLKDNEEYA